MIATMAVASVPAAALADSGLVFANGNFETGDIVQTQPPYDYQTVYAGDSTIDGWTVTGEVDWVGDNYWQAGNGHKSVDLNGLAPGAISQTIATKVNSTYVMAFMFTGNPDEDKGIKTLEVGATGTAAQQFSANTTTTSHSAMGWQNGIYTFVAKGSSTTVTFTSKATGVSGPVIDNIVITETIATGALCKNGGWKTMYDNVPNSFQNQGDCVSYYATGERNLARVDK
jgi:choice-of-anchor C domain-containing protein